MFSLVCQGDTGDSAPAEAETKLICSNETDKVSTQWHSFTGPDWSKSARFQGSKPTCRVYLCSAQRWAKWMCLDAEHLTFCSSAPHSTSWPLSIFPKCCNQMAVCYVMQIPAGQLDHACSHGRQWMSNLPQTHTLYLPYIPQTTTLTAQSINQTHINIPHEYHKSHTHHTTLHTYRRQPHIPIPHTHTIDNNTRKYYTYHAQHRRLNT